jgi:hypothetical protein
VADVGGLVGVDVGVFDDDLLFLGPEGRPAEVPEEAAEIPARSAAASSAIARGGLLSLPASWNGNVMARSPRDLSRATVISRSSGARGNVPLKRA